MEFYIKIFLLSCVLICLSACVSQDNYKKNELFPHDRSSNFVNSNLHVKEVTIETSSGSRKFEMEVADTEDLRRIGLMHRNFLDDNKGMLFIFSSQGYLKFWMKNTLISLDMLFLDKEGVIKHIVHNAVPCTSLNDFDCPKYSSEYPSMYVLEINGGQAKALGIEVGNKVSW